MQNFGGLRKNWHKRILKTILNECFEGTIWLMSVPKAPVPKAPQQVENCCLTGYWPFQETFSNPQVGLHFIQSAALGPGGLKNELSLHV